MEKVQTYYIIAEDGKVLMRDNKSLGRAAWLQVGERYDNIENVGRVINREILRATEDNKTLRKKDTDIYADSVCLDIYEREEDWEEVDKPIELTEEVEERETEDDNIKPDTEN